MSRPGSRTVGSFLVLFGLGVACTGPQGSPRGEVPPAVSPPTIAVDERADWPTFGGDPQRTGFNADESLLGPDNADSLALAWKAELRGAVIASSVLAPQVDVGGTRRDLVFVGDEAGYLYALDAATGEIVWERSLGAVKTDCQDMPHGRFGITGTPVVDRSTDRIYVVAGDGNAYAINMATGEIQPGWPVAITATPEREQVYGGMNLWEGRLYPAVASVCLTPPYHGRAVAIDVAAAEVTAEFYVIPPDGPSGGGVWGPGGVSIDPEDRAVYMATGNALTEPQHYAYAEHVLRQTPKLRLEAKNYPGIPGLDSDFGSTPILFDPPNCPPQLAVENKRGILFIYERDAIDRGPAQRLQVANVEGWAFIGIPAYSPPTRILYVSTPSDSGRFRRGLVAFRVRRDCSLGMAWQAPVAGEEGVASRPLSPPTVANGVVYVGSGAQGEVLALDGQTGQQLWESGETMEGRVVAAPMVVNGYVYVGSSGNAFYAFSPR